MHGAAKNGDLPLLSKVGNLSALATLLAILATAGAAFSKLDSIQAQSIQNCRAVNAGIILTLESSRPRAEKQHRERALDRTIQRFTDITKACSD